MPPLTLLCVGSLKSSWVKDGCADYLKRLPSFIVREISASKHKDPVKQVAEESQKLLTALEKVRGQVWVLDERGEQMASLKFAQALERVRDRGEQVTFVLGGAYGLTDVVRTRAHKIVSLSAMTLPHELCRLLFLEQIYRAFDLLKKGKYNH